jgi:DNA ligase-1
MLAQPGGDIEAILADFGEVEVQWKLDGARIQVHKDGDRVEVYTRKLRVVTPSVPEIVQRVAALPARRLILDGEAIALTADGRPHPFQDTMRRFGRVQPDAATRTELPLTALFFDCLLLDDDDLLDRPTRERTQALEQALPEAAVIPRTIVHTLPAAEAFLDEALERGHEGVMLKALDAPYEAGRRGAAWRKIKPSHTLDLVVLAAEWGSGRRQGWLSNLHLGAREPRSGGFVMLGKTFKGLTDELLRWQTAAFLERETGRDPWTVHVRPELVVEIAFDGVQRSPHYPGEMALRFARVKRYREDKSANEADTIDRVREIFERSRRATE